MTSAIATMLEKYDCKNIDEYRNALKEIIQETALCGLSRGGFFLKAAFYGGTALRIFHGLDRFSEDMDFSLVTADPTFDITGYFGYVEKELAANGFSLSVETKRKTNDTAIQSAFIKGNTLIHILRITSLQPPVSGVAGNERLKIKLEVDTDPPSGATFETRYALLPAPYSIRLYDRPSLFAGKLHAVLCRKWKNRVKGRDLYDYIWYLSHEIPVNIDHLGYRLKQSNDLASDASFSLDELRIRLAKRFGEIDFVQAARDVEPFIRDSEQLSLWNASFFSAITKKLTAV